MFQKAIIFNFSVIGLKVQAPVPGLALQIDISLTQLTADIFFFEED
jgi:hypothetical protein